jgi:hypothetical protein
MPRTRRPRREIVRIPRTAARMPEYDRGADCPPHLVTRRQLRERDLCPGGRAPVAVLRCTWCRYRPQWSCIHPTRGWLYDLAAARPKRVPTLRQEWALDRAMAARQTCPGSCGRRYHHVLPLRTLGTCLECADGTPATPGTYTVTATAHHLTA